MALRLINTKKQTINQVNPTNCPTPIATMHLIPEGDYEAQCIKQKKYYDGLYKREILCLTWRIYEGEHCGKELPQFIAFYKKKVGLKAKLFKEATKILKDYPNKNFRITPELFKNRLCSVYVRSVKISHDKKEKDTRPNYSIVERIISRLA